MALAGQFSLTFLILLILLKIFSHLFVSVSGFLEASLHLPFSWSPSWWGGDLTLVSLDYGSSNFGILGAASCIGAVIGALAAVVIVFELTGSYEWSVLAMVSVVTSQQFTRAYAGRSLFDRQLSLGNQAI